MLDPFNSQHKTNTTGFHPGVDHVVFDRRDFHPAIEDLEKMTNLRVRAFVCKQLAGPWYGEDHSSGDRASGDKAPVNVLGEMVYAYLAQLVGNTITAKVTAKSFFMRGEARMRQYMLDDLAREINLARSIRLAVLDALVGGMGIIRVGDRSGKEMCHIEGKDYDIGQIYAARVDMDDYCRDPLSRDESEDRWRAYRYRSSREMALFVVPIRSATASCVSPARERALSIWLAT